MKRFTIFAIILTGVLVLAASASAQQVRKLPQSAYIKSAKIEMGYAETKQDTMFYVSAMAMLDSLFMYYGPDPEALSLMSRIMAGFLDKTPALKSKEQWVNKFTMYVDSLRWSCESKTVPDKAKKECKDFVPFADSMRVRYWREFFNSGIAQLNGLDDLNKQLSGTDSVVIASAKEGIAANSDSALVNFRYCVTLDPTEPKAYVALGTLYEKQKSYDSANAWLIRGLKFSADTAKAQIITSVAYNYIANNDYCGAIPYFNDYLKFQPKDTSNMYNLSICYSRCKMYDSAVNMYRQMLTIAPGNFDALEGTGRFFNTMALAANDSARHYSDAKDDATSKKWVDLRTQRFDSSYTYFKAAYTANPKEESAAEEYAVVAAIREKYSEALGVYQALTQSQPNNSNYWSSLGDCYYSLKKWDSAATAYAKVAELAPDNRTNLERLRDAYELSNQLEKKAEVEKKLK